MSRRGSTPAANPREELFTSRFNRSAAMRIERGYSGRLTSSSFPKTMKFIFRNRRRAGSSSMVHRNLEELWTTCCQPTVALLGLRPSVICITVALPAPRLTSPGTQRRRRFTSLEAIMPRASGDLVAQRRLVGGEAVIGRLNPIISSIREACRSSCKRCMAARVARHSPTSSAYSLTDIQLLFPHRHSNMRKVRPVVESRMRVIKVGCCPHREQGGQVGFCRSCFSMPHRMRELPSRQVKIRSSMLAIHPVWTLPRRSCL
jgi:hypothetical protein